MKMIYDLNTFGEISRGITGIFWTVMFVNNLVKFSELFLLAKGWCITRTYFLRKELTSVACMSEKEGRRKGEVREKKKKEARRKEGKYRRVTEKKGEVREKLRQRKGTIRAGEERRRKEEAGSKKVKEEEGGGSETNPFQ
jgi:hypothetical protein